MYQDKRIYIELDDMNTIYSVKTMPLNNVCLRVPLKNWTRIRSARMSSTVVQNSLEIRERHEVDKHRNRKELEDNPQGMLIHRVMEIENTLKMMNTTLKAITDKLNEK